jgi:type I restriction enzyme R subunit
MSPTPEQEARTKIDEMLAQAGWLVQDIKHVNLQAGRGIAIREFPLKSGFGFADYLLYVDCRAAGVIEAKKVGTTLTGVEIQSDKYKHGLPDALPAWFRPLPFCYQSTGIETRFTNGLDPDPRSRQTFSFHRPQTLSEWLPEESPSALPLAAEQGAAYHLTYRARLQQCRHSTRKGSGRRRSRRS